MARARAGTSVRGQSVGRPGGGLCAEHVGVISTVADEGRRAAWAVEHVIPRRTHDDAAVIGPCRFGDLRTRRHRQRAADAT